MSQKRTISPRPAGSNREKQPLSPAVRAAVVLVCLCVIGGVGYFVIFPFFSVTYHQREAERAADARDFARAKQHLSAALRIWPHSGDTLLRLARTSRRSGDADAAESYLKQARDRLPDDSGWRLEQTLLQAQVGAVHLAEETLRKYLASSHPDDTYIFEAMVAGNLEAKSPQDAYQWACRWLERHPDDWQARYWKGLAYEAGMRQDLAAEEFQKVLEQKPGHLESHLHLAQALAAKGRFAEAAPHLNEYLRAAPENAAALFGLARCQRSLGDGEAARQTVERLLTAQPENAGGLLLRGQLDLDADHPAEALTWLRRARERTPNDLEANQSLAAALRLTGQSGAAEGYDRRAQEIRRDLKRMDELTKEIVSRPKDVGPRYEAGVVSTRLGRQVEAASWLVSVLLLDPKHAPSRKALAEALREIGDKRLYEAYRPLLENVSDNGQPPKG